MTAGITEDKEKYEAKMKDEVPLARISQPDEQAGMVVFLLSDRASCTYSCPSRTVVRRETDCFGFVDITGSDHLIDGGCTLW
jgi:hypothetical protein